MTETLWSYAEGCMKYTVVRDKDRDLPYAVYSGNRLVARAVSEIMAEDFAKFQVKEATAKALDEKA